ncbi:hypothetical protein JCM10213_008293 [Rhodosporidiobolus nylandii]
MDPSLRAVLEEIGCLDWDDMPVPKEGDFLGDAEDWEALEANYSEAEQETADNKKCGVISSPSAARDGHNRQAAHCALSSKCGMSSAAYSLSRLRTT